MRHDGNIFPLKILNPFLSVAMIGTPQRRERFYSVFPFWQT
jgi:hypothetical protein